MSVIKNIQSTMICSDEKWEKIFGKREKFICFTCYREMNDPEGFKTNDCHLRQCSYCKEIKSCYVSERGK